MSQSASAEVQPLSAVADTNGTAAIGSVSASAAEPCRGEAAMAPSTGDTAVAVSASPSPSTTVDDHGNKSRPCRCNYKAVAKASTCSPPVHAHRPAPASRLCSVGVWIALFCLVATAAVGVTVFAYSRATVAAPVEDVIEIETDAGTVGNPMVGQDDARCACARTPKGPLVPGRVITDTHRPHRTCVCDLSGEMTTDRFGHVACMLVFVLVWVIPLVIMIVESLL
ncbi:hypothetical protein pqer_cds_599 [Pandoravirus quercus]|uniref:Uncharacterized protein n=2 Tax=Pandoravirus TaxID=2060084 RepID=A0A2U7U9A3_9VIRU|nr:hypothetical protein pqer_cds_599 [Pandoravirus quercus]AVK75021.1 hypothetical protein pqer_cds_599 [Pandoravirus quercus]QBZ81209.1 hypothetical protein pclt_cds_616 [Pandoravirus celtis]